MENIVIIASTNRPASRTGQLAVLYQGLLQENGQQAQVLDLALMPADFTTSALYHNAGKSPEFNALRDAVETADKLVFIVPEYNGSFPGVLKAFLDGLHYPSRLTGKTAALVGISDGPNGNLLGMSHLTDVLCFMGVNVLGLRVKVPALRKNLVEGRLADAFIEGLMRQQAASLCQAIDRPVA